MRSIARAGRDGGHLLGILVVAAAARAAGAGLAARGLILLTVVDLLVLGRHRLVDLGPLRPLVEQSPVLARLASEPRGTRIVDASRNLPMVAGLAPISAYRTLDLPALEPLTSLAHGPLAGTRCATPRRAMRAAGVGVRVLDPAEVAVAGSGLGRGDRRGAGTVDDPPWPAGSSAPLGPARGPVLAVPHRPAEPEPAGPGSSP